MDLHGRIWHVWWQFDTSGDNLIQVFKSAHLYCITSLKDLCISLLFENVGCDNALEMYALGDTYDEEELREKAYKIIKAWVTK